MWTKVLHLSETRQRKTETAHFNVHVESKKQNKGNSLAVQWLGLRASTAEGPGQIPGQGTKIP